MKMIMKRAWEIYRNLIGDHTAKIATALRMAWEEARAVAKKAFTGCAIMKYYFTENAYFEVSFKIWENYGKKRIYFQSNSTRAQIALKGYIDCDNNNEVVISACRYPNMKNIVNDFINEYAF